MLNWIKSILSNNQFIPHGHCYLWQPELVGLHVLSDGLTALAYFSIPIMLIYFTHKRKDIPFQEIFFLFEAFIIACGMSHVMEVWTLWYPTYWLSGIVKALTAFISTTTALCLFPLIPLAVALPSPAQLEATNTLLKNEIAERQRVELELRKTLDELEQRVAARTLELTSWVKELEARNQETAQMSKFSEILQACMSVEEAHQAMAKLIEPLFPDISGGVFLINSSKRLVEAVATFGDLIVETQKVFSQNECWALRRGRIHWMEDSCHDVACKHTIQEPSIVESLCVPMMAQGEAMGILYLCSQKRGILTATKRNLAVTVAEHIALALANLKLHEAMKSQSIRDPLTGLFNRRYMEEFLEREIAVATRKQQSLGIIMIDVDHFKQFNDSFGHDGGDVVLRELGMFLQKQIRGSDIACRYGGEEFILIIPEASGNVTKQRAEQIREGVKHLSVQCKNKLLGAITLSLGVASFPEDGLTFPAVIAAADQALYRAKKEGRDRVVMAS